MHLELNPIQTGLTLWLESEDKIFPVVPGNLTHCSRLDFELCRITGHGHSAGQT